MNDIIVVGGGIGGLLLTQNLLKHNWTVTVVDANHSMRGSGSPRAIMHAFPGRSFQPHPLLKAAFLISREQMEIWQRADDSLVTHCEMIRPLQGQSGKRLQKSFKKYWANSADNWIHFSQNKASEGDAIHYTPAYAVNLYAACSHLKKELQTSGVRFITDHVTELCPIKDGWMTIGKKSRLKSKSIALALGLNSLQFFPALGAVEGGDILTMSARWKKNQIVACNGLHIAPMANERAVAIGSTRWPTDTPLTKEEATSQLKQRAEAMKWLGTEAHSKTLWRGMRAVWPMDRLPICGAIPDKKGLFAFLGLGGKALLWGPATAKWLAEHITEEKEIPKTISTRRIQTSMWFSDRIGGPSKH